MEFGSLVNKIACHQGQLPLNVSVYVPGKLMYEDLKVAIVIHAYNRNMAGHFCIGCDLILQDDMTMLASTITLANLAAKGRSPLGSDTIDYNH